MIFSFRSKMLRQIKSSHSDNNTHKCDKCSKSFDRKDSLKLEAKIKDKDMMAAISSMVEEIDSMTDDEFFQTYIEEGIEWCK